MPNPKASNTEISPTDRLAKSIEDALRVRIDGAVHESFRSLNAALLKIPGGAEHYDKSLVRSAAMRSHPGYYTRDTLTEIQKVLIVEFTKNALSAEIDSFVKRVESLVPVQQ